MEQDTPLIAFIKALARHQARIDAQRQRPVNQNDEESKPTRKQ